MMPWGVFPNDAGRILEGESQVPGMYVTGWIKRGPSGVVGTNKQDSVETLNPCWLIWIHSR